VIAYLGLTFVTGLTAGVTVYRAAYRRLTDQAVELQRRTIAEVANGIAYRVSSIESVANMIITDYNLHDRLTRQYDAFGRTEAMEYLLNFGHTVITGPVTPSQTTLYVKNETLVRPGQGSEQLRSGRLFSVRSYSDREATTWIRDVPSERTTKHWRRVGLDEAGGSISLVANVFDLTHFLQMGAARAHIGLVRMSVPLSDLLGSVPSAETRGMMYALTRGDEVLIASDASFIEVRNTLDAVGSHRSLAHDIPALEARLVALVPLAHVGRTAAELNLHALSAVLGSFVLFGLLGFLLLRYLSRRIDGLVAFIQGIRDGELKSRISDDRSDELTFISDALNEMVSSVDSMVEEVYLANLRKKTAELELLQTQINPHLLYNSLGTVATLIQLEDRDRCLRVLERLITFYRTSLSRGDAMIPVSDELEHVRSYVDIRQLQRTCRFTVSYHIEPSVNGFLTPRLVLQPFVENCLKHALVPDRPTNIVVGARRVGDSVSMSVADDGAGMARELVDQLNGDDSNGLGTGVHNVRERIALRFGDRGSVEIASSPGCGTSIDIRIPCSCGPD
jgi:two-component system sensor histidine kinase YesM